MVDFLSQSILMNMATADLYGTMDPFHRTTTSPKRRGPSNDSNNDDSAASDYQVNIDYLSSSLLSLEEYSLHSIDRAHTQTHLYLSIYSI